MQLFEKIKFNSDGLIPVIVYDADDNRPLTLCYMNREAVEATVKTGLVHVFRRSKNRLMIKGETSGHTQMVKEIAVDCEGNSLAIKVVQRVAACHAGYRSCYYRKYNPATDTFSIDDERLFDPDGVYK
ncbi:MAG TPA: phosphoribosyl-AMP cyclohydrolase [Planctomycetota bacterium]|nr:phosphoribosyl-AMP cyclohydrolase [Planctomycetota bacterium]